MKPPRDERPAPLAFYWTSVRRLKARTEDDANAWRDWNARLTPERRAKVDRYRGVDDRFRSLAAGLLLDRFFGENAASIRRDAFGKPTLDGGPFFSVSHSGDVVALAISSFGAIGCDVQRREKISPELVAKRTFHRTERERLLAVAPEERERLFYRIWTMKESYWKAFGGGSSSVLGGGSRAGFFAASSTEFCVDAEPFPRLVEPRERAATTFFRCWNDDERDVSIAVCATVDFASAPRVEVVF